MHLNVYDYEIFVNYNVPLCKSNYIVLNFCYGHKNEVNNKWTENWFKGNLVPWDRTSEVNWREFYKSQKYKI